MKPAIFVLALILSFSSVIFAFEQQLSDKIQEKRANEIFRNLRCLACEGQSIGDSNAEFAISLRQVIRENIHAGMTDEEIYQFMRQNYGDSISFSPPFSPETLLLWLAPFVLIVFGFVFFVFYLRKNR